MTRFTIVLLLAAAVLLAAAGAVRAQGWDDTFDKETLDARWTWSVPVAGPTYSLKERPGWLRIAIPQREEGYNHWNDPLPVDDAPQLRAPVPEGDWMLEAHIELQKVSALTHFQAGLLVGESDSNILAWGPLQGPGITGGPKVPELWLEATGKSGYAKTPGMANEVTLRLTKQGKTYRAASQRDGQWVEAGAYEFARPPRFIGIIGKTFAPAPGVTFDVDYVKLTPVAPDAQPAPVPLPPVTPANAGNLGERVKGFVVWESNRTGRWELYRVNTDGTGLQQITQFGTAGPLAYSDFLHPRVSPDGKQVLFAYGKPRAAVETWLVSAEGGDAHRVTQGLPLNWANGGREIIFLRAGQVWRLDMATGQEALVSPAKVPDDGSSGATVGDVRPDLKAVVLRTAAGIEYFPLDQATTAKTLAGSQPQFTPDGAGIYWANGARDIRFWEIAGGNEEQILGEPTSKPYDLSFFPAISADGRWLAYAASPGQQDFNTSDYEVFVQELQNWKPVGDPVRLTTDPRTDRWPFLWAQK